MLIGFTITILSWFGPAASQLWFGAPAIFVLKRFFGGSYDGFSHAGRAGAIVVLITLNVVAWAIVAYVPLSLLWLAFRERKQNVEREDLQ